MDNRLKQLNLQFQAEKDQNEQVADPRESLAHYRSKSTLNGQKLLELFYGPNWTYRERLFKVVRENPHIFKHQHLEEFSREEQRYHSFMEMKGFFEKLGITYEDFEANPNIATLTSVGMYAFDPAVCIKFGVHFHLYGKTIVNLGTEKHQKFIQRATTLEDIGSFSLTEVGHGSNVRNVYTTAVFDASKKAFILNTPNDLAIKFWIGATANLANMTVVFAQLYIDNKQYGVHAFLVEIRDPKDHTLKSGVIVGDCGPKNGLNGIDNGFLIFKNVIVPLDNHLDKFAQVSSTGEFTTSIEDPDKRFAVQLGSLSGGRVVLSLYAGVSALSALTIAVRYAAIRKQFGMPGDSEQSIIEYPLTQIRLMIPLATTMVYLIAAGALNKLWDSTQNSKFNPKEMAELHAISSITKGLMSPFANKTIMECRQILGGHGYHSYNRLGNLLHDHDINNTWEGDNNVLQQQTAKFLFDNYKKVYQGKSVKFQTVQFLKKDLQIKSPFTDKESFTISNIKQALEFRCNYLIQEAAKELTENMQTQPDLFQAWNRTLPFHSSKAALAYGDVYCLQQWLENIASDPVLDIAFKLWGLSIIENDPVFRDSGYLNQAQAKISRDLLLDYSAKLKDEAVGIVDALGPPDEILGSVFGSYDGDIYNKYLSRIFAGKDTFRRVSWWKEIHPK